MIRPGPCFLAIGVCVYMVGPFLLFPGRRRLPSGCRYPSLVTILEGEVGDTRTPLVVV